MYFVYIDESGDDGLVNSPTEWFLINCVLIHETNWFNNLNQLIALRRDLKTNFGIPARDEIKGVHFRSGQGVFRPLKWSVQQRMDLYEELLRFQEIALACKTFCVAIHKSNASSRGFHPLVTAWRFTFERIQKLCQSEKDYAFILHDEGQAAFVQRTLRFMRRHNYVPKHYTTCSLSFTVTNILEDPVPKRSDHSYFIQLADWNAYAAHRSTYLAPVKRMRPSLWDKLGSSLVLDVNKVKGGPPGIKIYP